MLREFPGRAAYRLADALDTAPFATGEDYGEAAYLRNAFRHDCRPGGPIGCTLGDFGAASRYLDCVRVRLTRASRPSKGDRVSIIGHNPACHGTVVALKIRDWPEGWSLVKMDGHLSETIVPINRLRRASASR